MTKPLNDTRISRTAQACLWHAANDDHDTAILLFKRIARRRTEAARREAEMLGRMLDFPGMFAELTCLQVFLDKVREMHKQGASHPVAIEQSHRADRAEAELADWKKKTAAWKKRVEAELLEWKKRADDEIAARHAEIAERQRQIAADAERPCPWWKKLFKKEGPDAVTSRPETETARS